MSQPQRVAQAPAWPAAPYIPQPAYLVYAPPPPPPPRRYEAPPCPLRAPPPPVGSSASAAATSEAAGEWGQQQQQQQRAAEECEHGGGGRARRPLPPPLVKQQPYGAHPSPAKRAKVEPAGAERSDRELMARILRPDRPISLVPTIFYERYGRMPNLEGMKLSAYLATIPGVGVRQDKHTNQLFPRLDSMSRSHQRGPLPFLTNDADALDALRDLTGTVGLHAVETQSRVLVGAVCESKPSLEFVFDSSAQSSRRALAALLADDAVTKVVHGSDQVALVRSAAPGCTPILLVDTAVAFSLIAAVPEAPVSDTHPASAAEIDLALTGRKKVHREPVRAGATDEEYAAFLCAEATSARRAYRDITACAMKIAELRFRKACSGGRAAFEAAQWASIGEDSPDSAGERARLWEHMPAWLRDRVRKQCETELRSVDDVVRVSTDQGCPVQVWLCDSGLGKPAETLVCEGGAVTGADAEQQWQLVRELVASQRPQGSSSQRVYVPGTLCTVLLLRGFPLDDEVPRGFVYRTSRLGSRVARMLEGVVDDLLRSDPARSLLVVGPPGSGKTSFIREVCRRASRDRHTVAIDSGALAGVGPLPHAYAGVATRIATGGPEDTALALRRCTRDCDTQLVVVEGLSTDAEALAARNVARGSSVPIVASACAASLASLVLDHHLNDLVGGLRVGSSPRPARAGRPTVDCVIEMVGCDAAVLYRNATEAVDALVGSGEGKCERWVADDQGRATFQAEQINPIPLEDF
eukprot:m51a1_g6016 hypothetical protein (753) ;mRNA; f:72857-75738